jgi:hypothetical protein
MMPFIFRCKLKLSDALLLMFLGLYELDIGMTLPS